jgi:hypothetical protein
MMVAKDSSVQITSSIFESSNSSVLLAEKSYVDISSSIFRRKCQSDFNISSNSVLTISLPLGVIMTNCTFVDNMISEEGAVQVTSSAENLAGKLVMTNVNFINNKSSRCGALKIEMVEFDIKDSVFYQNSGVTDSGAMCVRSSAGLKQRNQISYSVFTLNSAANFGGAIYWQGVEPQLNTSTFANNTACYGDNVASSASALAQIAPEGHLKNVASGQTVKETLKIALVDNRGQVISIDNNTVCDIMEYSSSNTSIIGTTRAYSVEGIFTFEDFAVIGTPGTNVSFEAYSSGDTNFYLVIDVELRACIAGEKNANEQCIPCEKGTYNFGKGESCADCPSNAECPGGTAMYPKAEYWRPSNTSETIFKCLNPAACLGGVETLNPLGDCAASYTGNLCAGCESGYSMISSYVCAECGPEAGSILLTCAFVLAYILLIYSICKTSIKSAYTKKSIFSVYLKLLLNYVQLASLVTSFDLNWPRYFRDLFKVQKQSGNFNLYNYTLFCIYTYETTYKSAVILSVLPVASFLFTLSIWSLVNAVKQVQNLKDKVIASLTASIFLLHGTITESMLNLFDCFEIETGEYWLSGETDVRCWTTEHKFYMFAVALPTLLVWSVGLPLLSFSILACKRRKLNQLENKLRFGFLYNGYTENVFYWEAVVIYRKVLIIACKVFFENDDVQSQALTVMLILLCSFYAQVRLSPFAIARLNLLERQMLITISLTIYAGLYFTTGKITLPMEVLFFVMVVILNLMFILHWAVCVLGSAAKKFEWISMLSRLSCCRGGGHTEVVPIDDEGKRDPTNTPVNEADNSYTEHPSTLALADESKE